MEDETSTLRRGLFSDAQKVRTFLVTEGADHYQCFRDFPLGACGNASDILAKWLEEQGYSGIEYVDGDRGEQSHGWLEIRGIVVDITSDQFDDGMGEVYVGLASGFHKSFTNQRPSKPTMAAELLEVYSELKNHLGT